MFHGLFKSKKGSSKTKHLALSEILRGLDAGRMQSVGIMQVIPLTCDPGLWDNRFVCTESAYLSTNRYGTMVFNNISSSILLVPCHAGYIAKQRAQDHAMAHAGIVPENTTRQFDTAMCIQQTQGGYIPEGNYQMMILPFSLREPALEKRHEKSYNKLWNSIIKFNTAFGLSRSGHLEFFLKKFANELDQFVAEFECVPDQVGAIVLINGEVVGVERAPSHGYWKSIWPALIRECYGSLALQTARAAGTTIFPLKSRVVLTETIHSLADLLEAVDTAQQQEEEIARGIVRELVHESFPVEIEEDIIGLTIGTIASDRFKGQMIMDEERVVYASLITSHRWLQEARWATAKPFSN